MLDGTSSSADSGTGPDIFKTAVIDILITEVQSIPGNNHYVLLLEYRDAMERIFQIINKDLSQHFPMSTVFDFENFTNNNLQDILNLKLKQLSFNTITETNNTGEVDILLDKAKLHHQQQLSARKTKNIDILELLDFNPDFDREQNAVANYCEQLVTQLENYQNIARNIKQLGLDSREKIPFNFLFRGPPGMHIFSHSSGIESALADRDLGSSKTSTTCCIEQVFYDMDILRTPEVVECSSSDLVI
ncbi:uncharacterized protein BO88DRAFT_419858 [Aspergillus vadensis CBS 113365]|uniref:Uncharacterized protein n=1 Tax=Aspergillus vadensis (strain CBS 113365 / IMI 142717 / IBT 24658) TaxID=1448311 RepID=A0A319BL05_ASPVC|nr:hypothetical protein BO88DRAFT_419858 [Aspergillus vadensis CBS 113365]PYH63988.1 hypothetical protein BO88DRAFT_419858 [Aspergillus vadensis CBS 113365]